MISIFQSLRTAISVAASHRVSGNPRWDRTKSGCLHSLRSAFPCVVACLLFTITCQAQQSLPTRHVPQVLNGQVKPLERLPATRVMRLDIVLPLSDQAGLDALLRELYDPASPSYRHFLTVAEFSARFGPSQENYDAVIAFAKANGLTVIGGTRDGMDVQVEGSVSAVENAFRINLRSYQHPTENRSFYAPDREPTADLPFRLWHISGLDNYSIPHTMLVRKSDYAAAHGIAPENVVSHAATGSGPSASFLGSDMRAAYYGGTALTGAGQNLGLLEFAGSDLADLNTYFTNIGQTNSVPVTLQSVDGTSTSCTCSTNECTAPGVSPACDDTEQTLDMTQAIGMAPELSSLVMYVGSTDTAIFGAMTTNNPLPATIGCSWGWTPVDPSTLDPYFERMAAQGQSFFAASGDSSTWSSSNDAWPADDANVVSVGGTDLITTGAGGGWESETAWADSGGGISPDSIPIPAWQQIPGLINSTNQGSTTLRNGPDVSANANFTFYVCADQTTCTANYWGGTSFAAPMWAGYIALANQQLAASNQPTIGFLNPTIYGQNVTSAYSEDFNDIISGTSGSYSAVTGYDLVTGWGSPGPGLIGALAGPAQEGFQISATPMSLTVNPGGTVTTTIMVQDTDGFTGSVNLTASGLPSGVTASFGTNPATLGSVLTLTAGSDVIAGTYSVSVTGTSGNLSETVALIVVITLNPGSSFTLGVSPASFTLTQDSSATSEITINGQDGFNGQVSFAIFGLPSGVSATFSPNPASTTSVLTLTANSTAIAGSYTLAITGTSGALHASYYSISLTVSASGVAPPPSAFGSVNVGTQSPPLGLLFTFNTAETLGSTAVLTQGATGQDFADAGTGTCATNVTYSAGQTCTLNVTFTPGFPGIRYGAGLLQDSDGNTIATGYLQGTGVGPQVGFATGAENLLAGGFAEPMDIAVDSRGNVYIADTDNNAVKEILAVNGSIPASPTINILGSGFKSPRGVAVDGAGNVYVADWGNGAVKEIIAVNGVIPASPAINNLNTLGTVSIYQPSSVAVDGNGNVYVADTYDSTVKEIVAVNGVISASPTVNYLGSGFSSPTGVAVDGNGNVYVGDTGNNAVKEMLAVNGSIPLPPTIRTLGSGFYYPSGVAVDTSGNVYVADRIHYLVKEILAVNGSIPASPVIQTLGSGFSLPYGVAVDSRANVYVADTLNNRAVKLDFVDPPSLAFATTSVGSISTDSPQAVTVENVGNAALSFPIPSAGSNPGIAANFSLNGAAPSACPLVNSGSSTPGTLAPGTSCQLLVSFQPAAAGALSDSLVLTDNNLNAAAPGYATQSIALSGTGKFILTASPTSLVMAQGASSTSAVSVIGYTGDVSLTVTGLPSGVTASFNPNPTTGTSVLTVTSSNSASTGTYTLTITATSASQTASANILLTVNPPPGIAPLTGNFGAVSIGTTSSVLTFTYTFGTADTLSSTEVLTQGAAGLDFANAGTGTCAPNAAYSVGQSCTVNVTFTPTVSGIRYGAVILDDSSGNLLATGRIEGTGIGPQLNFLPGAQSVLGSGFNYPGGVAVDGSGNVYVADTSNSVVKEILAINGSIPPSPVIITLGSGFHFPFGVAVDGSGNVFVADTFNNSVKKIVAVNGSIPASPIITTLSGGFDFPHGIAVDSNGNVYVADTNNKAVKEILAVNGVIPAAPTVRTLGSGFSYPEGVATDANGNIYVADSENEAAKEILAVNGTIPANPTIVTLASGLPSPAGIALDGWGNVYVADSGNGQVKEILAVNGSIPASPIIETLGSGFNFPDGVAVDGGGNVYVADTSNTRVVELDFTNPPTLNFATTSIGETSPDSPQTVTVENVGNAALTFPILSTGNNPSIAANFTLNSSGATACPLVSSGSSSPGTLAAGASCQLPISFTPQTAGTLSGSVVLTDNNLNAAAPAYSSQSILVSGATSQSTPTITWVAPAAITYGTALGATQLDATSSVAGTFAYSPASGSMLTAGQQTLTVTFTPTNATEYTNASSTVMLTVNQAVPSITWAAPAAITYGAALGAAQLDATSSIAGVFAYSPAAGTVLTAGRQTLTTTFTPTDTIDYTNGSSTVALTVNQATPSITWAAPAAITYGTALGSTQLNATSSVAGNFSYSPSAGVVLGAGPQILTATFTPTDSADYTTSTATVTLTVNKATPAITWATPAAITFGTPLSTTQLNASSSVAGAFTYSPVAGTVLTAGQQTLTATFTPTDTIDYTTETATVILTVNQATPAITWAAPATITYGTALSATQLNASSTVVGSFTYSPGAGTVLAAGQQTLTATFSPTDSVDYKSNTATLTLTVNKAVPTISWAAPVAVTYGTALNGTQLDAASTVAGSFTYSPAVGTVLTAGQQMLTAIFTPTDTTDYTAASASVTLTVNKATPPITWTTPAAITYGTALSAAQLNARSTVVGTFTYSPAAGTVLNAGAQTLVATFTPTDSTDYTAVTATDVLTVNKALLTISWTTPAAISYGTALSGTQLDATSPAAGAFVYSPAAGTVLPIGNNTLSVTVTPTNPANYTTSTATAQVTLTVNKATPAIAWATPAPITYGTALSATQLDASSAVAGTYTYSPAAGMVLTAGQQTLSVTFTPTNTTDYTSATATVTLTVNKATPTITWATPGAITYGIALSGAQLDAKASVPGAFVYSPASGTVPAVGTDTLNVTFTPTDATDYTTASDRVLLKVNPAPSFTLGTSPASLSVAQGASGKTTITVTGQNGFTGSVTLAASSLPTGVTAAFATNPTAGSSVLTLKAGNTATVGSATITIKGTSGSLTASTTIALTVNCTPTAITPYISINGGSTWTEESSATVNSPSTVVDLGPQPTSGGSWSWMGPSGYTSTSRQINSIPLTVGTDPYIATYTNASGCKSTETFTITVK